MPRGKNSKGFFTDPLTKKKAKRQAKLAGRLAVRPERRQVQAEKRATDVSRQRINAYFPQYGKAVDEAATRTAGAYQQAGQGIGQASQATANYAETLRQRLADEARADAARRGANYDPSGDQTNAAAQLARMTSANTLQGVVGAQGASQSAHLADKKRIGERERIEQLLRAEQRGRSYDADLRALAREEGGIRRQTMSELRDSERDYLLARKGLKNTRRGQNITAKNAALSAETTRRGQDLTAQNARRSARTTRRGQNISRQNSIRSAADSEGAGGGKPSKGDVRSAVLKLRNAGRPPKSKKEVQQAVAWLHAQGVDPKVARRAVKRYGGKKKGGKKGGLGLGVGLG